jgi:hypothetical protein
MRESRYFSIVHKCGEVLVVDLRKMDRKYEDQKMIQQTDNPVLECPKCGKTELEYYSLKRFADEYLMLLDPLISNGFYIKRLDESQLK